MDTQNSKSSSNPSSSSGSGNKKSSLGTFIFNIVLLSIFLFITEKVLHSSVFLMKPFLLVAGLMCLIPLIWYFLSFGSVIPIISSVLLIIDLIYMFINRNATYKFYIPANRLSDEELEQIMPYFKKRSAVLMIYDYRSPSTIENYKSTEPIRSFVAHRNLMKDNFRLQREIRSDPFCKPTGIVKRALVIIPFRPEPMEIDKYKIKVIRTKDKLEKDNMDKESKKKRSKDNIDKKGDKDKKDKDMKGDKDKKDKDKKDKDIKDKKDKDKKDKEDLKAKEKDKKKDKSDKSGSKDKKDKKKKHEDSDT